MTETTALVDDVQRGFWPTFGVGDVKRLLIKGMPDTKKVPNAGVIRSNIAYCMQYLQMINSSMDAKHHVVMYPLMYKNFVINGCGIVEAILYYIVLSQELEKYEEWDDGKEHECKGLQGLPENTKAIIIISKKREIPKREDLTFNKLCQKVESKGSIPGFDKHKELSFLRKLRNDVHIQTAQDYSNSHFNKFSIKNVNTMKGVLFSLLSSTMFSPDEEELNMLEFLKVLEQ